jgi:hypothetical protein
LRPSPIVFFIIGDIDQRTLSVQDLEKRQPAAPSVDKEMGDLTAEAKAAALRFWLDRRMAFYIP